MNKETGVAESRESGSVPSRPLNGGDVTAVEGAGKFSASGRVPEAILSWRPQIGIARIIARLNVGGPAMQAILMTEALGARGYGTVLIAGQVAPGEAGMDYLAQAREVNVVALPTMSRSLSWRADLVSLFQLTRLLRQHKPLIVHTHTAKAGALGRLAAMMAGIPLRVHTFHGHVFHGYFPPLLTRAFLGIERFLARHTDCVIAISESQKKELTERYRIAPADKVAVVPLGLDLDPFLQVNGRDGRRGGMMPGSVPGVGWVGRFTAIKDPNLFLDCANGLKDSGARFVMVGGGELLPACQQRVRQEQMQGAIRFLGWQRDLATIYADVDMIVCTSINEGTPVALIEAMACAKAVVSTDVGGVRDLMAGPAKLVDGLELFENGILVKREARLLERAIRYLLDRPEQRHTMGQAGRSFVRKRFSQKRLADDLDRLYISLARAKGLL